MKIIIASDHRGFKRKQKIIKYLKKKKHEVIDLGTNDTKSTDYPDYAFKVGEEVIANKGSLGILICSTGTGMSIAANKVKGIRCAKVATLKETKLAKEHNDANVIALSAKINNIKTKDIIDLFIKTPFSKEERHQKRVDKINEY